MTHHQLTPEERYMLSALRRQDLTKARIGRELGRWEIDTVMGHGNQHCIVSLIERKSSHVLIGKLNTRPRNRLDFQTPEERFCAD